MQEATRPEIALLVRRRNRNALLRFLMHLVLVVVLYYVTLVFGIALLFALGAFVPSDLLQPTRFWTYAHVFALCAIPLGVGIRLAMRWYMHWRSPFIWVDGPFKLRHFPEPSFFVFQRYLPATVTFLLFHIVLGVSTQLALAWGAVRRIVFLTPKEQKAGQRILEWIRKQGVEPRFHPASCMETMDPCTVSKLARAGIVWYKIEDGVPMLGLNRAFDPPSPDEGDTE